MKNIFAMVLYVRTQVSVALERSVLNLTIGYYRIQWDTNKLYGKGPPQ